MDHVVRPSYSRILTNSQLTSFTERSCWHADERERPRGGCRRFGAAAPPSPPTPRADHSNGAPTRRRAVGSSIRGTRLERGESACRPADFVLSRLTSCDPF
jgi:hypothetical protein